MKKISKIADSLSQNIVRSPKKWLISSFIILLVSLIGISKITSSFTVKVWLNPEDQRIADLEKHEATFGSSETIDLAIYAKNGIFTKKILKTIEKLTEEMWQTTGVVRVESITNFNWIESFEDDINIAPFIGEDFDYSKESLENKKKIASNDSQLTYNFNSPSTQMAYIRSYIKNFEHTPPYEKIVQEVESLVNKYKSPEYEIHIGGIVAINNSLKRAADKDSAKIFPIVIFLLIAILFVFFRNFLGVVYPFLLIISTIVFTFGVEGFLGLKFNNIISAVPAILMSIGLADAIHILVSYRHNIIIEKESNELAAINSLKKNFIPTILTTITTAVGFFSLTTAEIAPIHDLGLLSGIGTIAAWFFTYFVLGPLLKYVTFKDKEVNENLSQMDGLYSFCYKNRYAINILAPIVAIIMTSYGFQNKINADPVEYFSDSTPIKKTFNLIEKQYGGSRTIELVFDTKKAEGIKSVEFMKNADKYINWLESQKEIIRVTSVVQIIKKMNQILESGDIKQYKIPNTDRAISDQLFLYSLGLPQGMDLKNQISLNNQKFRAIVMWDIKDTMNAIKMTDKIIAKAKDYSLSVYEGGQTPIYNRVNDLVVETFFTSMSLSIPIIFLLIFLVFKDLKLALLSLIPNLFPLGVASGIMYFNGDFINIGNVIVFSVCLGIAVDDTIHFIANYKIKKNQGMSSEESLKSTLSQTGKALVLTTLMLVIGFGLFVMGDFVPNQKFGMYCSIILTLAIFADLVILPAILMVSEKDM